MPGQYVGISDDNGDKLLVATDGTLPVSGTVTSTPSGTQTVAGTVNTIEVPPAGFVFYLHSMSDVPGVAAANNFLSVFNPAGSGKVIVFYLARITSHASAAASASASMDIFRITAASGGTQISAANVNRFVTTDANPVAEVRVGNPTVTIVGTTLLGTSPIITSGAGSGAGGSQTAPPGASFVCAPGQGLVMRTASGDTDQLWNLTFTWAEA